MVESPKPFSVVTFDKSPVVTLQFIVTMTTVLHNFSKLPMFDFNHGFFHPHELSENAALVSGPFQ